MEVCSTNLSRIGLDLRRGLERNDLAHGVLRDLDDPYVTLHNPYVESCWWAIKKMFEQDLLYLDTGPSTLSKYVRLYSSHEVALGYKEVEEPSVYVKFKLVEDDASILAWTTTPWTLPGNVTLLLDLMEHVRVKVTKNPEKWDGHGGGSRRRTYFGKGLIQRSNSTSL